MIRLAGFMGFLALAAAIGGAALAIITQPRRSAKLEPLPAIRWEFPGENR